MQQSRKLYRSQKDRVLAGLCGGLGEYLSLDPVIVRVVFVAVLLFSLGIGLVIYVIGWIIVPGQDISVVSPRQAHPQRARVRAVIGLLLLVAGLMTMSFSFIPGYWHVASAEFIAPLILIVIGLILLLGLIWKSQSGESWIEGPSNHGETGTGNRKLFRPRRNKKIAGVCAAFANYFDIDINLIRLLWVALTLVMGAGIIIYLVLWIVIPLEPESTYSGAGSS